MSSTEFSKSLLKSAAIDGPRPGAKEIATAKAVAAIGSASAVASVGAVAASKVGFAAVAAAAVVAGAAGLGGGYALGRSAEPRVEGRVEAPAPAPQPIARSNAARSAAPANGPSSNAVAPVANTCGSLHPTETRACTKRGGRALTFGLKNQCSEGAVDVFWVNDGCEEMFSGVVQPGATFYRESWEGHVFRIRDHATHRLLKEFTPILVDGMTDREKYWSGPPTELPEVTIDPEDRFQPEAAPGECTHGGGRAARIHVRNDRRAAIAMSLVDAECREVDTRVIEPGGHLDESTSEGHAFRVRDASGALLLDIPPAAPDMVTYLSVP